MSRWNAVVLDGGATVYVVGDLSFHRPDTTARLLSRLRGKICWLLGNHDKPGRISGTMRERCEWVKEGLHTVQVPDADARGGIQRIVLCHYAMRVWDKSHFGAWHLYGHSHGSLPDDPNSLSIDIGVDSHAYMPVSYEGVKRIMARKVFKPIDHHGEA